MGEFVARNILGWFKKINKRKSCCILFVVYIVFLVCLFLRKIVHQFRFIYKSNYTTVFPKIENCCFLSFSSQIRVKSFFWISVFEKFPKEEKVRNRQWLKLILRIFENRSVVLVNYKYRSFISLQNTTNVTRVLCINDSFNNCKNTPTFNVYKPFQDWN